MTVRELINSGHFENIRGGTINHSADINCPFDGIFFYLPHAVEMMLELFRHIPESQQRVLIQMIRGGLDTQR